MLGPLDFPQESDKISFQRQASKSLVLARNELTRRVGDWLMNAESPGEFSERLAYIDNDLNSVVHRRLPSVSDGKAKLARALFQEWKIKRANDLEVNELSEDPDYIDFENQGTEPSFHAEGWDGSLSSEDEADYEYPYPPGDVPAAMNEERRASRGRLDF